MIKAVVQARVTSGRLFRVQLTACQNVPERRNFSSATTMSTNLLLKPYSNSKNISSLIRPISASQISLRCLSSVEGSVTLLDDVVTPVEAVTSLSEPSFHSLGLAHHYPSGWLQAVMEQVHLQFEMPWWATIVVSKLLALLQPLSLYEMA